MIPPPSAAPTATATTSDIAPSQKTGTQGPRLRPITVMACAKCNAIAADLPLVDIAAKYARWTAAEVEAITHPSADADESARKLKAAYLKAKGKGDRHARCHGVVSRITKHVRDDRPAIEEAARRLACRWPTSDIPPNFRRSHRAHD